MLSMLCKITIGSADLTRLCVYIPLNTSNIEKARNAEAESLVFSHPHLVIYKSRGVRARIPYGWKPAFRRCFRAVGSWPSPEHGPERWLQTGRDVVAAEYRVLCEPVPVLAVEESEVRIERDLSMCFVRKSVAVLFFLFVEERFCGRRIEIRTRNFELERNLEMDRKIWSKTIDLKSSAYSAVSFLEIS